jgi:hypothetical protein
MEKWKQRDERKETERRQKGGYKRKEQVAISSLRTGYTRAPRRKSLATHYAPSATLIYPSTTYCGNAKKLRTREQTWT